MFSPEPISFVYIFSLSTRKGNKAGKWLHAAHPLSIPSPQSLLPRAYPPSRSGAHRAQLSLQRDEDACVRQVRRRARATTGFSRFSSRLIATQKTATLLATVKQTNKNRNPIHSFPLSSRTLGSSDCMVFSIFRKRSSRVFFLNLLLYINVNKDEDGHAHTSSSPPSVPSPFLYHRSCLRQVRR